jgi:cell division protein FtsI/penicillin-binding protein 2
MVENGYYAAGAYVASFIGFVPADKPKYVILVKIERPQGVYYGSTIAAPVFAELARIAMLHAGDMPSFPPARRRVVPAGRMSNTSRMSDTTR